VKKDEKRRISQNVSLSGRKIVKGKKKKVTCKAPEKSAPSGEKSLVWPPQGLRAEGGTCA